MTTTVTEEGGREKAEKEKRAVIKERKKNLGQLPDKNVSRNTQINQINSAMLWAASKVNSAIRNSTCLPASRRILLR